MDRAFGLDEFDYGWLQVIVQSCFLAGLVALGAAHRDRLGQLGKIGVVITLLGWLIVLGGSFVEYWVIHESIFMPPLLDSPRVRAMWGVGWAASNLAKPLFYVGLLPLGVTVLRARRLAPWARVAPLTLALLGIGAVIVFIYAIVFTFDRRIPSTHFLRNIWLTQVWIIASSLAWAVIGFGLWAQPTEQLYESPADRG